MSIDEYIDVELIQRFDQSTNFGRFQFHVIAVQVHAFSIFARAYAADGAILRGAIVQAEFFVTISIINGSN